ncbi:MAG: hypothetical protein HYU36_15090 [Planctomycetes bacterium]|nr:hypothetical protein [Planctomycetota bacterium]
MPTPESRPNEAPSVLQGRSPVTERILALLDQAKVTYHLIEHPPVFTSTEAAQVRGTRPEQGAKALVVKAENDYHLLLLPGNRKADNRRVRQMLASRHLRFAGRDELLQLTGCLPGSVPPFGNLFGLKVWMDEALGRCEHLAFNAGSHTVSIRMKTSDLIRLTQASMDSFILAGETS